MTMSCPVNLLFARTRSKGSPLRREVVFCARLKAVIKLDLERMEHKERQTMLGSLAPVRGLISVHTMASSPF